MFSLPASAELGLLRAIILFGALDYFGWVMMVVRDISTLLDINVFTVRKVEEKKAKK